MNKNALISIVIAVFAPLLIAETPPDIAESMRDSLLFLEVSSVSWEQLQPWRQTSTLTVAAYAVAVGPNHILTTAAPLSNAVSVRARRYDQNEYIPATIQVIDYEYNLCLLELDRSALQTPLKPLEFADKFSKGKELRAYRLSSGGEITQARAMLDRAEVRFSPISFVKTLQYVLSNPSRTTGAGEVYCLEADPIGLACWSTDTEAGLVPAETINRFLEDAQQPPYRGFGAVGFETTYLLDPAVRKYLKMPEDRRDGVYVNTVYKMGSGSSELVAGDVILSINQHSLNPYGRYQDSRYERIGFEHLLAQAPVGDTVEFVIWRDGKEESVDVVVRDIKSKDMLVPHYQYDRKPEYLVLGGFVFQSLTRDYMTLWGDGWQGKVPPHLYHYYRDRAFNPSEQRREIVLLSYVLPTEANLGYHQLGRLVVKSFNGKEIASLQQMAQALARDPESPFYVVEFELDSPAVVIARAGLEMTHQQIMNLYGIPELAYFNAE